MNINKKQTTKERRVEANVKVKGVCKQGSLRKEGGDSQHTFPVGGTPSSSQR